MIRYDFTRHAQRQFLKLAPDIRRKIISKVEHYLSQPNPLVFAKRIVGGKTPAYRFRVLDDYRVVFDWENNGILILKVGHRSTVYR